MSGIAIFGGFGTPNAGDEIILHSLLQHYSDVHLDVPIHVLASDVAVVSSFVSHTSSVAWCNYLNEYFWMNVRSDVTLVESAVERLLSNPSDCMQQFKVEVVHRLLRSIDVFHIGGGGYWHDRNPHIVAALLYCAEFLRRENPTARILVTGQTLGPFGELTLGIQEQVLALLRSADRIDMRDDRGANYLKTHGIAFQVTCDDALLWRVDSHRLSYRAQRPYGLLQVVGTHFDSERRLSEAITAMTNAAAVAHDHGFDLVPVSFCPVDADAASLQEAFVDTGMAERVIEAVGIGADSLAELFGGAAFAIGSRLHFAILSHLVGTPVFSIRANDSFDRIQNHYAVVGDRTLDQGGVLEPQLLGFVDSVLAGNREQPAAHGIDQVRSKLRLKREAMASVW